MNFAQLLKNKFIMLDGAMGTMLQKSGLEAGALPELLSITNHEKIIEIHKSYIDAGAQIVYTNTFGANRFKLQASCYSVEEVIKAAVKNAASAAEGRDALVALDIGPSGRLLAPSGDLSFDEAYDAFAEQIVAGDEADLIVIETMTDLAELRAALLAAKENSNKPVLCTMTFEENLRTFAGCSISSFAIVAEGLGADAVGINCSLGPKQLLSAAEELSKYTSLPIVIKPNAGLPNPEDNSYDITADEFAAEMEKYAGLGVRFFGGCCGTTPEYISKTKEILNKAEFKRAEKTDAAYVCSASKAVVIDSPKVIGERINPTGKKKFRQALIENDMGYILNQAIEQEAAGAEILDVNVGLPEIDEKDMMVRLVVDLCGVTTLPLQIDSTDPAVIEAALRVYSGKAIVNSVNGEKKSMQEILPIVKKYGAAVVALTLDENGIPKTAEERVRIAKKIQKEALRIGIKKEDIYIDCLTLTVSAEQDSAYVTLKALSEVKNRLGLKTVLGVSNISFGLPCRELVNSTFLTMALSSGLDLPIINPNAAAMMGAVRAYRVLKGIDKNSECYIKEYADAIMSAPAKPTQAEKQPKKGGDHDLKHCVRSGLCEESARLTEEALKQTDAMSVVNMHLIPALDEAGADFEANKIFLPQLILSANAAQSAFEVIKNHIKKSGEQSVIKGSIILATVKGDIHDIGKNIVKVLLENYGYEVIDLGRDVDPDLILRTAKEKNIKLVGLSALMTTTLSAMEETIRKLRESHSCRIVVGGAVLTPEYAEKIGADFYAKDAKAAVDVARKVFG